MLTASPDNCVCLLTLLPERFAKFTTRKGRKVTSFGVLFDFTGNDDNTTVQKVEDMVKESWVSCLLDATCEFGSHASSSSTRSRRSPMCSCLLGICPSGKTTVSH